MDGWMDGLVGDWVMGGAHCHSITNFWLLNCFWLPRNGQQNINNPFSKTILWLIRVCDGYVMPAGIYLSLSESMLSSVESHL